MNFGYEIIRSQRKTLCVSIADGKVTVRAPLAISAEKIESFVRQKSHWIEKHLENDPQTADVVSLKKIYARGVLLPLSVGGENKITESSVSVSSPKCLKRLYISEFAKEFSDMLNAISDASGLKAASVSFKAYRSRWGCCDNSGAITFNYKLLMLPTELWKCVIVHELCHTRVMNHSAAFYALAVSVMPDYATVHKGLKRYSYVCRLYG